MRGELLCNCISEYREVECQLGLTVVPLCMSCTAIYSILFNFFTYSFPVAVLCWRQGAQAPPNLAQAPKFLIGSRPIVISLSRCCLRNDERPGLRIFFLRTATVPFLMLSFLVVMGCQY